MCGIAGTVGYERALVETMIGALRHRGPDDEGVFCDASAGVVLGHRRLSILDLSPAGRQPMGDATGDIWISYNGEVYNFRELRARLEPHGYRFRTGTDTEVLLAAYRHYGDAFVEHLRGMFAIALWDRKRNRLLLVRDRLGIKPLYYARPAPGKWLFASEIRALLATGEIPRRLDPSAVAGYFTFGSVPSPATPIAGIRILPPGTLLSVSGGETKLTPYWEPDFSLDRKESARSEAEVLATIRETLEEAVRLRMIADVPLGAFLSGGIDSSAVVACMSRQGGRVKTFTITFPGSAFDEAPFARRVAEIFGTEHTELPVTPADVRDTFAAFSRAIDLPSADGINTYFVSRAARQAGMTVALSGLGGDELFAGYALFRRLPPLLPLLAPWRKLPQSARTSAAKILSGPWRSIALDKIGASLATAESLAHLYFIGRTIFLDGMRQEILREPFRVSPLTPEIEELARKSSHFSPIDALSFLELRHYMLNTLLRDTDNMSMAHALEVRVPLIDHHLVETLAAIPAAWKVGKDAPKRLLVKALDGLLPPQIVHRPKMGFTFPFAHWLKGELAPDIDAILADFRSGEILDARFVNALWQRFRAGARDVSFSRIWTILAFEIWFRHVFEGEAR